MSWTTRTPMWLVFLAIALAMTSSVSMAQDNSAGMRKVVKRIDPQYPGIARSMRLAGNVKIEAVVSPSGIVKSVEIKGGNPLFAESAKNAILQWTWDSGRKETHELIEIKFSPQ